MSIDHQPEWEQRMRHAVVNPKLPKAIGDDFIACFAEMDNLREQIHAAKEAFSRIRALAGAGPNDPMPAEHYVSLALQTRDAGAAAMRSSFEKLRPILKQTAAQLARGGAHEMVTGYVSAFDASNAGKELLAEVERLRDATQQASLVHHELQQITGTNCLPSQMPRMISDQLSSLRRKVAVAEGMRSVVVEAAKETMVIAGGDDGGFGVQDSLQPTPLAGRARDALSVWEEANK